MSTNLIGRVIKGQFRVDSFLDSGGMGSVYRVWDTKRNVPLAMKVLHSELAEDPAMFTRFKREARALQKLAHPNIIPFYGLYETQEFIFMLERFIDGPTLRDILRKSQGCGLSEGDALIFLKAISSALGYAHENGVIHCDIKSANVMVDQGGSIYLGDFGIARHADSTTTMMGSAGTPAYMAPEQIEGEPVTPATDIYALGILLFEMLTGERPFRGNEKGTEKTGSTVNERIRYAQLNLAPPNPSSLNPKISNQLSRVILQSLEKDPAKRFQSCQEFLGAVCQALGVSLDTIPEHLILGSYWSYHQYQTNNVIISKDPPRNNNISTYLVIGGISLVLVFFLSISRFPYSQIIYPEKLEKTTEINVIPSLVSTEMVVETAENITNRSISPTKTPTLKSSCPGAEPQRVKIGDIVQVCTKSDRVIVRSQPLPGENEIFRIYPGTVVEIIDGPRCSDDSSWWLIRIQKDTLVFKGKDYDLKTTSEGWIREGSDNIDQYYICKENR
ncbi:MAG TPA: serine/threonine protein kinase [Anaerolineaceae bacterium]|nr:serine/threonine protein kinase [Anaerolineaceae bacterium]